MPPNLFYPIKIFRVFYSLVLVAMLAACAGGQPLDDADLEGVPPGRGLLTGTTGEFVIYRE